MSATNAKAPGQGGSSGDTGQQQRPADSTTSVEPEFGRSRRRFLVAMFMIGAVKPERLTERVLAELEADEGEAA